MSADIVVIGIGNEMHGDDGFGVHAVRSLRGRLPEEVELVEGGTCAADLLHLIEGKRLVVIVDAIDAGEEPGALFRFTPEQVKPKRSAALSLHDFGLYELLFASRLLGSGPQEVVILAAQVSDLGPGWELSPPLRKALGKMEGLVREELRRLSEGTKEERE